MLDKANLTTVANKSPDILELEVQNSPKVDMSAFSFGISTKIPRLHNAIPQIAHCNQPISMSYIPSSELLTSLVREMFHAPGSLLTLSSHKKYITDLMVGLPNSGCQLHVMAPPHVDDLPLEREIRAMGIDLTITTTRYTAVFPFPKAYFSILKKLYETRTPNTKWISLFHDHNFVSSLPYLVQHFKKL
jgi:hypothetical protein